MCQREPVENLTAGLEEFSESQKRLSRGAEDTVLPRIQQINHR
jgi:hypothetical protein